MTLYANIDVAFYRDPRLLKVGSLTRLLYIQVICYCRENLTDGRIVDEALAQCGTGVDHPRARMRRLCEAHADGAWGGALLEETAEGWRIPERLWKKWNPTKAQVEVDKRREAERKREYRARQSNGYQQVVSQECPNGTGPSRAGTRDVQPEPEPELNNSLSSERYTRPGRPHPMRERDA